MRSCVPSPISSVSSRALTLNSRRRPSTLVTSASAVTVCPTGVAARWRTLTSVPTTLSPERLENSFASPETISFWDLPDFIRAIEAVGFSAQEHRLHWHAMLALPLLLAAMLVVGTTFSLRLARHGKASVMVVAGLTAGFAFYILSDVVFAIGLSGRLPIALAAWAPAGIAMLLGLATLFHIEDG